MSFLTGTPESTPAKKIEMFASPPSHLPVIVCVLTSSTLRNELLMHLKIHATQSLLHQQSENELPMHALGTMCNKATMSLEMFASPPSHFPVIVCVLTSSTLRNELLTSSRPRNIFLMRLELHAAQSAQCMRFDIDAAERPCA